MSGPRFKASLDQTMRELRETFRKWGIGAKEFEVVYSSRGPAEVIFRRGNLDVRVRVEWYPTARENLRAVYLIVEAARMQEVRGGSWQEALREYLALPAGAGAPVPPDNQRASDPWAVLGLVRGQPAEVVRAVYRARAAACHPDESAPGSGGVQAADGGAGLGALGDGGTAMKPTPAQRQYLSTLKDRGGRVPARECRKLGRIDTMAACLKRGWIELEWYGDRGNALRITAAGRAALPAPQPPHDDGAQDQDREDHPFADADEAHATTPCGVACP